ncbi:hypothetical protein DV515_00015239 [Chloebia gouldiae]|uniref:Helically-extended SH3 domain-containing protein n=1 Tax=Chloebia gouldiae TaxID=44316 RepID=A0A3L8RVZ7_CHLGU|nr:hypothetical protein DV515_00015239 [Chloebia gouldiae]
MFFFTLSKGPKMARAPWCSDKVAALMVSAGLAIGRSVLKSTSCRLYTFPREPPLPQGWHREMQWGAAGKEKGMDGRERLWGHLNLPMAFSGCRESQVSQKMKTMTLKPCKKEQKMDREFQKKFKFEGSINVLTQMMVDPAATEKRGGAKNLPLRRGEILDVIQFTNQEQILCRNSQRRWTLTSMMTLRFMAELTTLRPKAQDSTTETSPGAET